MPDDDASAPLPAPDASAATGGTMPPPPPTPPVGTPLGAPAAAPFLLEPYRTAPDPVSPRGKYALFGGAGLVVGLGLGLVIPYINFPSTALPDAVSNCGLQEEWGIELGDDGQSLTMDGEGDEDYALGVSYPDSLCILMAVDTPDSVVSRMGSTRALDGIQTAQWGDLSAYWSYHPDDGLDVVLEVVDAD